MVMGVVRQAIVPAAIAIATIGCAGTENDQPPPESARAVADTASREGATARDSGTTLPPVGVAIHDKAGRWCVALGIDSLSPKETVTIVFPDSASAIVSLSARATRRATPCATAFPQLQLVEDAVYDLTVLDTAGAGDVAPVAIAVVSGARWSRGADGAVRADLDGDGNPEEARVCRAHEGEYFTLWSRPARDSIARSVWGRYFDWGAFVDANCAPGEGEEALSYRTMPDERAGAEQAAHG